MATFAFIARDSEPGTTHRYTSFLSYYISWVYSSLLWAQMWTIFRSTCYSLQAWYIKSSIFPLLLFGRGVTSKKPQPYSNLSLKLLHSRRKILQLKLPISEHTKYLKFYLHVWHLCMWGVLIFIYIFRGKCLSELKINLITTKKSLHQHFWFLPVIPKI